MLDEEWQESEFGLPLHFRGMAISGPSAAAKSDVASMTSIILRYGKILTFDIQSSFCAY
ncbi:hypothetical protein [Bradyrhizobium jicamae]|uniref:hypothetical protein n=1 Tax=Bradyrhizobium jicamae TaxID=280332 RepID=UPI0012EE3874|nr:hypothetical protein [Bradyrhizobium jicamae]